jgi:uncharacterized membrane protein
LKILNSIISNEYVFIEMNNSKSFGIVAIAAVAVMLIASAAAVQEDAFAGKKKKYESSVAQANDCGNGELPLNVYCQNLAALIQGDGNAMNIIGAQG